MRFRKKPKPTSMDKQSEPARNPPQAPRAKQSLLSLEQRLMFDAAAAATASEVASEQVAQEQAEAAVSSGSAADSRTAEQNEAQGLLEAIATYSPGESRTEVVFVDPTVPNYQDLLGGMNANIEVIMLDGGQDGIEQMANALSGRTGIDAIHLISHGDAGTLQLGTGTLNAESMSGEYADELATIQQSLSEQADILVYGCDFAQGDTGQAAVNLLADLTGADVQASTDLTGHISLGGDWEFEVSTGTIETSLAITDDAQMNWAGILGTETVRDTFSTRSYSADNGTQSWSSGWSETDAGGGGVSGGDIRISSSQLRIDTNAVGNAISRGVDLSQATSATLTFDYVNRLNGTDRVELRVSTDDGITYRTLSSGVFSNTTHTGRGAANFDLSDSLSANTRIQFIVTDTDGSGRDRLQVDNVQVSYNAVNSAPAIRSNGGGAAASINMPENRTTVTTVAATDADAGQTLTYSIVGGADAAQFAVNSSTGQLSFVSAPNFEAPVDSGGNNVYDVRVQVSDGNGGTDSQAIAVAVTNANDAPTDLSLSANTVTENATNGTVVGRVTGTDPDAGDTKRYTLTDSAGGRFAINRSTGVLTVANGSLLNYETAMSHTITVRVTDRGGLTYNETFTVNVSNVNEAPTGANATVTMNEDTARTLATANFGFSDVDAGDSLSAVRIDTLPSAGRLTLSGVAVTAGQVVAASDIASGNLVFTPAANANGTGYARVTFSVRDSNNAYDTTSNTLTFNVTAVNDAPTDLSLSANTVAENARNGTVVGRVTGADPDRGDTKRYTLTDSAGGRFAINSSTGVLTVANGSLLNYETATSHTVTVRVTDRGGLTYTEAFQINLTDVNEATPMITSNGGGATASITVVENTTAVTTVTATDVDTRQTLTYSISGGADATKFAINNSTGALSFVTAPDHEAPTDSGGNNIYNVTVQVSDGNGRTDTQTIAVTVTNANETPTDLSLSANTVAENAVNGTVVGRVTGTDPDAGDTTRYSLTDSAGGRFAINSSTGVVTVASGALLNYEAAMSHTIIVRVMDAGGLIYDKPFTITLTDVTEILPLPNISGFTAASSSMDTHENGIALSLLPDVSNETGKVEFGPPQDLRKTIEMTTEVSPPIDTGNLGKAHGGDIREDFYEIVESSVEEKESVLVPDNENKVEGKITAQEYGDSASPVSDHADLHQPDRASESVIGATMTVGLAGIVLQGAVGTKEKLIANIRRPRNPAEGTSVDMQGGSSSEDDNHPLQNESEHEGSGPNKPSSV